MNNREKKAKLYLTFRPFLGLLFSSFYNPKIIGAEHIPAEGRMVIAGNHKHALDPILVDVSTNRVVHTLAKKELHDGIFGWFFKAMGTIPVDLHADRNKEALEAAIECLKDDCLVNLSPEAKRNYTDEVLLPFKKGAVVMALRTGSKIVPYSITGDYKFRSKNLKIVYGKPVDVTGMEVPEANEYLFNVIHDMIIENRD
ncbi:lysophospholipid acyltransferase family protein [Butyrivibrio proteoclasticus]|uniref:lysophospholipid acyltransferase family protein n=1 Tax=Butyrivibrio proteoclasticus TaxID=43305 RepID=UPI0009DD22DE|nr:lysophospholipid acyltransferase family protein [Butyrivibrio proteoclasticus]